MVEIKNSDDSEMDNDIQNDIVNCADRRQRNSGGSRYYDNLAVLGLH